MKASFGRGYWAIVVIACLGIDCQASSNPAALSESAIAPTSATVRRNPVYESSPTSGESSSASFAPPVEKVEPAVHKPSGPRELELALGQTSRAKTYPSAHVSDGDCWRTVELFGESQKDYEAIARACGTPTGMLEYTKPVSGVVHDVSAGDKGDPNDIWILKIRGGMCYRFFAVGDGLTSNIDMHVTERGGALVAMDDTKGPVAIVMGSKPWCIAHDSEYHFEMNVDGGRRARYMFGVWARPLATK